MAEPDHADPSLLGRPHVRVDGVRKATGATPYASDRARCPASRTRPW